MNFFFFFLFAFSVSQTVGFIYIMRKKWTFQLFLFLFFFGGGDKLAARRGAQFAVQYNVLLLLLFDFAALNNIHHSDCCCQKVSVKWSSHVIYYAVRTDKPQPSTSSPIIAEINFQKISFEILMIERGVLA